MGVLNKNNQVFPGELVLVYCGYWRTWSRVLFHDNHHFVEVNLTPINPTLKRSWEDGVRPVVIRRHRTGMDPWKDKMFRFVVRNGPLYTRLHSEVAEHVGAPIAGRLFHEDFLPYISWPEYEKFCNGGCPFDKCRKTVRERSAV